MDYTDPTVRDRIVTQLLATLTAAFGTELGAANIQEFSEDGNKLVEDADGVLPPAWILITAGEDDVSNDSDEETIALEFKRMPITVDVHIQKPLPTGLTMAKMGRRWAARVEKAIHADRSITEDDTGVELAIDIPLVEVFYPIPHDRQRDNLAGCTFEVHYDHEAGDPWTPRAEM